MGLQQLIHLGEHQMRQLIELCLEVTSRCLMHCLQCSTTALGKEKMAEELTFDEICSLISDFDVLGGTILEISGGEPILHPYLLEIVSFAKEKGIEVRLYTCGVSYQGTYEPLGGGFLKKLRNRGLDKIIFNLQGAKSEVHDPITRRPGSFIAVCESIKRAKRVGFWVGTHFVPMKPNAESFGNVLELARDLAIDEVALLRFVPQGRGKANEARLKLRKDKLWTFLGEVVDLRRKFQNKPRIRTGCPLDFVGFIDTTIELCSCEAGLSTCTINPRGDVIPCPAFKHLPEFIGGNVKTDSLRSIWMTSELLKQFRTIEHSNILVCNECKKIDICKGRCLAQRLRLHGDLLKGPDPDCYGPYQDVTGQQVNSPFYCSNMP